MRTIRVTLDSKVDATSSISISTEIIVEEGEESDAGKNAKEALDRFIDGYVNG